MSDADEIKKLKDLFEEGVISEEEFETKKNELLKYVEEIKLDQKFSLKSQGKLLLQQNLDQRIQIQIID